MALMVIMEKRLVPLFVLLLSASIALGGGQTPDKKKKPTPTPPPVPVPGAPVYFNVTDYGATGNGTTDDTAALQAAVNAAAPSGTVYVPNGNYKFSGITLGDGITPTNISIVGESESRASFYYVNSSSAGIAIKFNENQYARFQNFSLINSSPGRGTTEGIQFSGPGQNAGTLNEGNSFAQIAITQFHYGFHASDTHGNTGSECQFDSLTVNSNDVGILDDDANGLNFTFRNLQIASNGTGVEDTEGDGGIYVLSGASSNNGTDFNLHGLAGYIQDWRGESNGGTFLVGGKIAMNGCKVYGCATALNLTGGWMALDSCVLGGPIDVAGGPNHISLRNTWVMDTVPMHVTGAYGTFEFMGVGLSTGNAGNLTWSVPDGSGLIMDGDTCPQGYFYTSGSVTSIMSISYASTVNIDFDGPKIVKIPVTGNLTLTQSNSADGIRKQVTVMLCADSGSHTIAFPSGWQFIPASSQPSSVPASVTSYLTVEANGAGDANITAGWKTP